MPSSVQVQASERVDAVDLRGMVDYPRELTKLLAEQSILDRQSRILRGFRVQLTDQNTTPGRIVVHCGTALDRSGRMLINEAQGNATRTITLEGANTTFFVELEFVESDASVDSRAFWDPTVDQGTDPSGDDKPDGQEFSNNVSTRKISDWKIVQPVSTSAFERDLNPSSTRIPLIRLRTDASNKINSTSTPGLTTEKFATTLLEQISSTKIRVQNARFMAQIGSNIKVSEGDAAEETVTISSVDYASGAIDVSTMINTHVPGDIVRVVTATEPDFITEADYGRYRRPAVISGGGTVIDYRDRVFQGDEVHGSILSRGHGSITEKSSVNLQSLADYVDFLAAQIQEMKWGITDPYATGTSTARIPPGLQAILPSTPRHYDRVSGVMGAKAVTITVGDGINSFGDFNGTTQAVIQAAHDALPAGIGGRIFLKRGSYTLSSDINWTNTGSVVLEAEEGAYIGLGGGKIHINTTGYVTLLGVQIAGFTSNIALLIDTSNPSSIVMTDVAIFEAAININSALPGSSSFTRLNLTSYGSGMAATPLLKITGTTGTISGTFTQCRFWNFSMTSLTCCLIDGVNGSPTLSLAQANFVECEFASALLNFENIHLGSTANVVNFTRCTFASVFTICHVRATGGTNIKFVDCVGFDGAAAFFQGSLVSHLEISGYVNNNAIAWPIIDLWDCSNVKITRCDMVTTSGTSLSNSAIKVVSSVADIHDYLIEGNSIYGAYTTNNSMGFLFDLGGSGTRMISGVIIKNNNFRYLETGGYFSNTGVASTYKNIEITGNQFRDSPSGGINFKLGLLFGSASSKNNIVINDNTFDELNPMTTNLVNGNPRSAICILGTNNYEFTINGNKISQVGYTGYELANTAGIYIVSLGTSTISNNTIKTVIGKGGFGIHCVTLLANSNVCGNTIFGCTTAAGGSGLQGWAAAIYLSSALNVSVTGNYMGACYSSSTAGIGVGSVDASGQWSNVTVSGNTCTGTFSAWMRTVQISTESTVQCVTITGNTGWFQEAGVYIAPTGAGANYSNISISGNTFYGLGGILVYLPLATTKRTVSITGNTLGTSGVDSIMVAGITGLVISGNSVYSSASKCNIIGLACVKSVISNNYLYTIDVATPLNSACNIKWSDSGNIVYEISDNICDRNVVLGGTPNASIYTNGSGNTVAGQGLICDNLIKAVCVLNPFDSFHDVGSLFP